MIANQAGIPKQASIKELPFSKLRAMFPAPELKIHTLSYTEKEVVTLIMFVNKIEMATKKKII